MRSYMSYKIWTVAREAGKRITAEREENVYSQVYICTQVKKKRQVKVFMDCLVPGEMA